MKTINLIRKVTRIHEVPREIEVPSYWQNDCMLYRVTEHYVTCIELEESTDDEPYCDLTVKHTPIDPSGILWQHQDFPAEDSIQLTEKSFKEINMEWHKKALQYNLNSIH